MIATTPKRERRENQLLTLLKIPVFRRIWAAIAFSSLGDWLGLLANTALAQQLTSHQSGQAQGAAISGVILVRLAPDLLFGAVAAAIADKFDRRKIVIAGDVAVGLLYASIAFGYNLVWLYVAQFVIEAIGLFTQPCKQVIWVSIVPKRLLPTANQLSLISVYGTVPIAAGAFALLSTVVRLVGHGNISHDGVNAAIVIALVLNAVTFAVSASTVFLSRNDIPAVPREREQEQGVVSLIREGVAFVRRHTLIRGLYVGIIGAFAGGGLTVGVAQLWVATLSAGAAGYSIMFGTVFTGLAVGMLVGPRILPSYARNRVFGLAIGGAGIALLLSSLIRDFILAAALAATVGAFAGMAWIIGYTLIGQEVEDRMRGRIFAFVLSSVRIVLLLTIAIGPVLAGLLGSHAIRVGRSSYLRFSGPGLTLLLGGIVALGVSYYATSRSAESRHRLRDLVRKRLLNTDAGRYAERNGLFISVDGLDATTTAAYAKLVSAQLRARHFTVVATAEPTASPTGLRVRELLAEHAQPVEPETAALLSAADRAEHVAAVIRPALERGDVVVCDRYVLTSLALHGGGRGADVDRVRSVNAWSTGGLVPDLTLVPEVEPSNEDVDAIRQVLDDEIETHPLRHVRCPAQVAGVLPPDVLERLARAVESRGSLVATVPPTPSLSTTSTTSTTPATAATPEESAR
ncbi:MAG: dTMP kinase [Jatrophihabitans sp.]